MGKVIVIQFVTADGVIEDPDGSEGTPGGGWCYRFGPEAITGDKFDLGSMMDSGVLLFGRRTWQAFSTRWPSRTDDFSTRMNRARKVVVSTALDDVGAWNISAVLRGSLANSVADQQREGDIIVMGSTSVVRELAAADLVDQYRLLVFPIVLGQGERLFPDGATAVSFGLVSAQQTGPLALLQYDVDRQS